MDRQIDRQIDVHLKKGGIWEIVNEYYSIDRQIDGYINRQIASQIYSQKGGELVNEYYSIERQIDGYIDKQIDIQMHRYLDRQIIMLRRAVYGSQ